MITSFASGDGLPREINKVLGRQATDEDIADIITWIEVKKTHEKVAAKKPGYAAAPW